MAKTGPGGAKDSRIKNTLPRRMYKERGQLKRREHLGILEKKKDYQRRSKDFKQKKNIIQKLGLKAELRNPDEFYHQMVKAKNVDGEHKVILKQDQEKARKIREKQDMALVGLRRTIEANKAEKLKQSLHLIDFPKQNQHIKFVSSYSEIKKSAAAAKIESSEMLDVVEQTQLTPKDPQQMSKLERQILQSQSQNKQQYKKLADAMKKAEQFGKVEEALLLDKHMKGKGKKRKIEDDKGNVTFKWFSERKR